MEYPEDVIAVSGKGKPAGKAGCEELFIVPIGGGRHFLFRKPGTPGKAWDARRKRAVGLFGR